MLWWQIAVVTGYGFMATVIILVMPLVTEFYELRKFLLERASVEPGSPDQVDLPPTPPPPDDDAPAADDQTSSLKPMKSLVAAGENAEDEVNVDNGNAMQTDTM